MADRSKPIRDYFSSEELHTELGEVLGRTSKDIRDSIAVDVRENFDDQFVLRAAGKDMNEAEVLARAALAHYEEHLIKTQGRINEELRLHLEQQIELQERKVAAAKAKMDAALEKLKSEPAEDR